jgi:hypothetical protein
MMSTIRQKNDLTDEVQYACHWRCEPMEAKLCIRERERRHAGGKVLPRERGQTAAVRLRRLRRMGGTATVRSQVSGNRRTDLNGLRQATGTSKAGATLASYAP